MSEQDAHVADHGRGWCGIILPVMKEDADKLPEGEQQRLRQLFIDMAHTTNWAEFKDMRFLEDTAIFDAVGEMIFEVSEDMVLMKVDWLLAEAPDVQTEAELAKMTTDMWIIYQLELAGPPALPLE